MKQILLALVALLLIGGGAWWFMSNGSTDEMVDDMADMMPVEPDGGIGDGAAPLDALLEEMEEVVRGPQSTIGSSVDGEDIVAHHFGDGDTEVLLVANLHGGDAPNTAALANEFVDYFKANEDEIPDDVTVTIIPTLNPDGLAAGSRFNQNEVDLNRNFECDWAATSMWRDQEVSGGSAAFSEPEAVALRDYVASNKIASAIVWFAAEGKVYPSACGNSPSSASKLLAATFATPAGYPTELEFDAYQINGDMTNWLADMGVPAISVLLSDRANTDFTKNKAGVMAVLATYAPEDDMDEMDDDQMEADES